ncbi:collagen alpha-4(VI) chain-like [Arapaima gigas]
MTRLGLGFLLKHQFTEAAGSRIRQGVPQIGVVITGRRSADRVEEKAEELKKKGSVIGNSWKAWMINCSPQPDPCVAPCSGMMKYSWKMGSTWVVGGTAAKGLGRTLVWVVCPAEF